MISALSFIPKGFARSEPVKLEITEEEASNFLSLSKEKLASAKEDYDDISEDNDENVNENEDQDEDVVAKYGLDDYSSEEDEDVVERIFTSMEEMRVDSDEDQHLFIDDDDEEPDEKDDWIIQPTDHLLVAVRAPEDKDDLAQLEYYIYEEDEDNLYVHHDVLLPSFPLCLEWIGYDCKSSELGFKNFVAVGTFENEIELWNMDILDPVHPYMTLGETKKSKKKEKEPVATMCMSWNHEHAKVLASGHSDNTVKLWDMTQPSSPLRVIDDLHKDKVQTLAWSKVNASILATGGFDKRLKILDIRTQTDTLSLKLEGDAEVLKWDPFNPHCLAISDDSGIVTYVDTRQLSKKSSDSEPLYSLQAHRKATSTLDFNPFIPNVLMTGSLDKSIKLWDLKEQREVYSKSLKDKVFSGSFCRDSPFIIAFSGTKEDMTVLNLLQLFKTDPELEPLKAFFESKLQ